MFDAVLIQQLGFQLNPDDTIAHARFTNAPMPAMEIRSSSSTIDHVPDRGDGVAIAALYLMVLMIVSVLIRLAFRFSMIRTLQWDDAVVSVALVRPHFSLS
jgi:hypothetical protein